jgi:hypothetical protein
MFFDILFYFSEEFMKSVLKLMTIIFIVSIFSISVPKNALAADVTLVLGSNPSVEKGKSITLTLTASNLTNDIELNNIAITFDNAQFDGNGTLDNLILSPNSPSKEFSFTAKENAQVGQYDFTFDFQASSPSNEDTITNNQVTKKIDLTTNPQTTPVAPVITQTPASNNADVLSIICKEGIISPLFNPLVKTGYIVNVADNISQANFTVNRANNKATVLVAGNRLLTIGDNNVTITITAEDGKTKNIYTINVIKGAKIESSSSVSSVFSSTFVQSESRLANNVDKGLLNSLQGLKEENEKLKETNSAISEKFTVITILLVVFIAILIASLVFVIVRFREI